MKEENVVKFYILCNKLKDVVRTGWKVWNVKRDRLESVAEHIYGTQMLALAINSEFKYDIDISKVILMLSIHELGEIIIGDLTLYDIDIKEKEIIEHQAVKEILKDLLDKDKIEELFIEFDSHKTKESIFAYQCDKLECDIQSKLYDMEGCVDLDNQNDNKIYNNDNIQKMIKDGNSFSDMWLKQGQKRYPYDENFISISNYVLNMKKNK